MSSTFPAGPRGPVRARPFALVVAAAAAVCVAAGCLGPGDPRSGPEEVSVRDSAGITIVTNRGEGWSSDDAWRLEPDLLVGDVEGPLAFGRINWVSPGGDGGILVLDGQTHRVHVFDSAGKALRSFGGEGDGPGEFRAPAAVTRVEDGRIAVSQGFPPVLHWVSDSGDYLGSTRLPASGDAATSSLAAAIGAWQVSSGGRAFVQVQILDPASAGKGWPVALLEVDPAGASPADTLARWSVEVDAANPVIRFFEPIHTWMPRADGTVVLSAGSPYEVRWIEASSRVTRVMRREVAAVGVGDSHRSAAVAGMKQSMESLPGAAERMATMLENAEFAATVPEIQRVWVSEGDGRLWLGVHDAGLFDQEGSRRGLEWANAWDVFERDGAFLGRIPMPEGFSLRVATESALYGVWMDDLDVSYARRYRIVRPVD